jgi:betaine-aldehyde dehydrogenase
MDTGTLIGRYARGTAADARRAVEAAHRAFLDSRWRYDRALRARVLNAMADRFAARIDDLVDILTLENGKVKPHGRLEVESVPQRLRFNAALALTDNDFVEYKHIQLRPGTPSRGIDRQ